MLYIDYNSKNSMHTRMLRIIYKNTITFTDKFSLLNQTNKKVKIQKIKV